MLIVNRVPELVAAKFEGERVNAQAVQKEVGLTYSTVHSWLNDNVTRYDATALEAWCKYLNCDVGDLLVFKRDSA